MTNNTHENDASRLLHQFSGVNISDVLRALTEEFPGKVCFSTSFSGEDQVITHLIALNRLPVWLFTLDTGRLFTETYSTWSRTREKYGLVIKAFYPDPTPLEAFVSANGPNAFYASLENRKQCCYLRKVEPLRRALQSQAVWVTGLRAEHSPGRQQHEVLEWDEANAVIKYNPLLEWSGRAVDDFIATHDVPYNVLHDHGFVSIGCAPCTRAVRPGEDFRAGRWWWEQSVNKECGLHAG